MATAEAPPRKREVIDQAVIRFAGDSGDGMQITGSQFTNTVALYGNDLATFPDFPAEIRAPAGTLPGVSGYQIHFAASDVYTPGDAVDALLEARADVRAYSTNHEGNTALHAALAGRRDLRIVSRLLAGGADVNAPAAGGYTPLHIAAFHDDVSLVEALLARGAAGDAREDQGRTPLAIAEEQGQQQVARRLRGEMP